MITFTQQRDDDRCVTSVSISDDACAQELVEHFRTFMLAIGYHPDTVAEYLPGTA